MRLAFSTCQAKMFGGRNFHGKKFLQLGVWSRKLRKFLPRKNFSLYSIHSYISHWGGGLAYWCQAIRTHHPNSITWWGALDVFDLCGIIWLRSSMIFLQTSSSYICNLVNKVCWGMKSFSDESRYLLGNVNVVNSLLAIVKDFIAIHDNTLLCSYIYRFVYYGMPDWIEDATM